MKTLYKILFGVVISVFVIQCSGQSFSNAFQPQVHPFQLSLQEQPDKTENALSDISQKSKGRAVLMSLLVPGTGEMYIGRRKMGTVFISSELTLWASYFLLNWISDVKEDDYILYAVSHAGINAADKSHQFYVNIEDYASLQEYNQAMLQSRSVRDLYPENGTYDWNWETESAQNKYQRMRVSSDRYKNASLFMIGGVVLNHLVSAIDVMRIMNQQEQKNQTLKSMQIHFAGKPEGGMTISLRTHF